MWSLMTCSNEREREREHSGLATHARLAIYRGSEAMYRPHCVQQWNVSACLTMSLQQMTVSYNGFPTVFQRAPELQWPSMTQTAWLPSMLFKYWNPLLQELKRQAHRAAGRAIVPLLPAPLMQQTKSSYWLLVIHRASSPAREPWGQMVQLRIAPGQKGAQKSTVHFCYPFPKERLFPSPWVDGAAGGQSATELRWACPRWSTLISQPNPMR